jgi:hypothetical protein
MATVPTNRHVTIKALEKLLRIKTISPTGLPTRPPTGLPTRPPTRLPTRPPTRLPTRSSGSPLRLDKLDDDARYNILQKYSELVNKPKIIAKKLIDTIKSDFDSEEDREKAKIILETITDIDTINEIRHIINKRIELGNKHNTIWRLIQERFTELVVVEKQREKLKDLNSIVKTFESDFTKIKKDKRSISRLKTRSKSEEKKIFDNLDTIFLIIKEEQAKAKNILTRAYLKTLLNMNISDKQRMIEKTVKEVEDNVMKELVKARILLKKIKSIVI